LQRTQRHVAEQRARLVPVALQVEDERGCRFLQDGQVELQPAVVVVDHCLLAWQFQIFSQTAD